MPSRGLFQLDECIAYNRHLGLKHLEDGGDWKKFISKLENAQLVADFRESCRKL